MRVTLTNVTRCKFRHSPEVKSGGGKGPRKRRESMGEGVWVKGDVWGSGFPIPGPEPTHACDLKYIKKIRIGVSLFKRDALPSSNSQSSLSHT